MLLVSYRFDVQSVIMPSLFGIHPLPFPKLHPDPCTSVGMPRHTDRQTDVRYQYTFRLTRNVTSLF